MPTKYPPRSIKGLPDYLTTSQAADQLGVRRASLWRMAVRGQVPYTATPYGALYHPRDIDQIEAVHDEVRLPFHGAAALPADPLERAILELRRDADE